MIRHTDHGPGLFDRRPEPAPEPAPRPKVRDRRTAAERFADFDAAHPEVYARFSALAFEALRSGRKRFSARVILGRMRWDDAMRAEDGSGFKLNDHYSPHLARKWMREHPEHAGFFETRGEVDAAPDGEAVA